MTVTALSLFDQPVARRSDPATSHAAGRAAVTHRTVNQQRVLDMLRANPRGLTDEETGLALKMDKSTAGKRRLELQRAGLVEKTELTRPTLNGVSATVWRAVVS